MNKYYQTVNLSMKNKILANGLIKNRITKTKHNEH